MGEILYKDQGFSKATRPSPTTLLPLYTRRVDFQVSWPSPSYSPSWLQPCLGGGRLILGSSSGSTPPPPGPIHESPSTSKNSNMPVVSQPGQQSLQSFWPLDEPPPLCSGGRYQRLCQGLHCLWGDLRQGELQVSDCGTVAATVIAV